ncbi:hypothetical protein GH5_07682 [Leishmania sp. Ghana 2012 LV757]|uniref:hypothetical protein n=1 Tax=Leishmania sp. Ghana 2012 LV757 TaxID=2803181 RepID=UPI001B5EFDEC|nr:hypothetical protein GH5_07682 [Leishmania sp. Ghana 2012 LV757]
MIWFKRKRPTAPIYVPDPRRPSIFFVLTSLEPLLSALLMVVSHYFLVVVAGSTPLSGPGGLWQTFGRQSRARMQSHEATPLRDPPLAISLDLLVVVLCIFSSNALLDACSRVLLKEQRRVEDEAEAGWLAAVSNPATRKERLSKDAQELAERVKLWQENDERRTAGQTALRERIKKLDVMADEVMTNIIVLISVALSLEVAHSIYMQPPNQVRGLGMACMLTVLIGGLIICAVDSHLSCMHHYCSYVNVLCITSLLVLVARASVLAN